MLTVGIRDLKSHLSRYIARVRRGEAIVVTDHGDPVAHLVPIGVPEDVEALLSEGRISWSGGRFRAPREAVSVKPGPPLSGYVSEDRG